MLVGIDMGTTYSSIARLNGDGKAEVIVNKEGERKTPSVVMFKEGKIIIGEQAKNNSVVDPYNVCQFVKKQIGKKAFSFDISVEQKYSAEEISALILKKIIEDAEYVTGEKVEGAILTVPVYFDATQRKAIQVAAEIAGVNVLGIINEPAAATIAYCHGQANSDGIVMVYDIGGGSFDVTIMRLSDNLGKVDVLATAGNRNLGGYDFDNAIISKVIEEFDKKYNLSLEDDDVACQDLRIKAEHLKKTLSEWPKASISIVSQGNPLEVEITRDEFESLIRSHVASTKASMLTAMNEAKTILGNDFDWKDISKILLVGGSTKIPCIYSMIKEYTGITPSCELNPDEAVAIGATYYANSPDIVITEEKPCLVNEKKVTDAFSRSSGMNKKDEGAKEDPQKSLIPDGSNFIAPKGENNQHEKTIVEAKPSRKLFNGIDCDNGIFYKTEYGKSTVISYDEAFEDINNAMCKMLTLGPEKNQNHQSYYNEFLRIARVANTDRSKLDTDVLVNSIFQCMDALISGTDGSVANILAQNIFYYLSELYDNREYCYDPAYVVCSMRDTLFSIYLQDIEYYRQIVKAFYMVIKADKSMPHGFFDLSYVTAENEKGLDIYYLELADYYTKKAIDFDEKGYEVAYLETLKKSHELYDRFRKSVDSYLNGSKKEKKEEKAKLIEVYNEAISFTPDHDDKTNYFIVKQPYNVGLAYAISRVLNDNRKASAAIKKLSFGKDILSRSNKWMSSETNGAVSNTKYKTSMGMEEKILSLICIVALGVIVLFSFNTTIEFFSKGLYYETGGLLKYWGCIIAFLVVVLISRGAERIHKIISVIGTLYFIAPRIYQMYLCLTSLSILTLIVYFFIICLIIGLVIKVYD